MAPGDIHTVRIPTDLDYLAPADTTLTNVPSGAFFDPLLTDNVTITMVDVSGRNTVRKVVVLASGRVIN